MPLVVCAASFACGDPPTPDATSQFVVRDSAGVLLVDNGSVDWNWRAFELGAPLFRVGWSEHPDSVKFSWLNAGAVLPSGDFAVADGPDLWVLEPDGSPRYSLGGAGDGPGEFYWIFHVTPGPTDTVVVHDWERARVATFAGPELVSDQRLPDHERIYRNAVQGYRDGRYVLLPTGSVPVAGPESEWHQAPMFRLTASQLDSVALIDWTRKGRHHLLTPTAWARVSGERVIHMRGDELAVHWYSWDGALGQVARWSSPRVQATDSVWDEIAADMREIGRYRDMPESEFRAVMAERRAAADGPLPTYGELRGDLRGGVWFSEFRPSIAKPTQWTYVDPSGTYQGSLAVPEGLYVLAFGTDVVLGVETSALGVPAAVVYPILRRQ